MLEISFNLPECESAEIIPIADVHIGNPLCNEAMLKEIIDYVLEEPEDPLRARICLLNGDLTESPTKTNRNSNVFDMQMTPSVQVATMIKYLKPLTEKSEKYPNGKILSYCSGNHDQDRYKETGISAAESIAVALELEDRFSMNGCYSFINLRRLNNNGNLRRFTLYNQHMTGGATTIGAKANRAAKISNGVIADVIVGSHLHTPITFKEDVIIPVNTKDQLQQMTITYVVTNAFLRYGDYAQKMGLKPSSISVPRIYMWQGREQKGGHSIRNRYVEVIL